MYCVINNVLEKYAPKGKRLEVIRRYLRIKYHVNIDTQSIKERLKAINKNVEWKVSQSV